jgi:thiamine-monophosphate kinase
MRARRDEDALISAIAKRAQRAGVLRGPGVVLGIGHDCAVLRVRPGESLAWHVDDQVEDVHFRRRWASFGDVGWKAAAAALSDLAACGARPLGVQLALELPRDLDDRSILETVDGFVAALAAAKTPLVGGNVSARPPGSGLSLSVSVAGAVKKPFRRDTARAGDGLYVSGAPGRARLALLLLERGERPPRRLADSLLRPRPLLALGRALATLERGRPTAAMDVSDGLARSVVQLARASRLRATLEERLLPVGALVRPGFDALELVLEGGEDYELLIAAPESFERTRPARSFIRIGRLEPGQGSVLLRRNGSLSRLAGRGFGHR